MCSQSARQATDPPTLDVIKTARAVRTYRKRLNGSVALVPTMGALHEGHLDHIRRCREVADHVMVSVFVNPTQFDAGEDFQKYPRSLDTDIQKCRDVGASAVFAPEPQEMYPPDTPQAQVNVPAIADELEGPSRPGHFQGVCLVVTKLLNLFQPDVVSFGYKDYQQMRLIEALVKGLLMPVRVLRVPTMRESDGLAMSSRNQRLNAQERKHALGLSKALRQAKHLIESDGETDPEAVQQAMQDVMRAHRVDVDYAQVRHPLTLKPLSCIEPELTQGVVALVAGRVGSVRLIDNMVMGKPVE